jgi:GAF domain
VTPLDVRVKHKPAVDEAGFQQVLAAAYVLQQHNDSLRAKDPRLDTGWILTQVAETQSLLRAGGLALEASAKLIADRLRSMTDSAGVSISLTRDGYLNRIAESGAAAKVPGSSIASHSLVATERLKNGRPFQSADAQKDIRLDIPGCRELGVRALLAVPVQRLGKIAGLVEVRWNKPDAFHECDVRTCQLMAGLVGEILEREGGSWLRRDTNPQASSVQSAFELAAEEDPVSKTPNADGEAEPSEDAPVPEASSPDSASVSPPTSKQPSDILAAKCRVCGRPFLANEAFCGNCSMPRVAGTAAENLQSKWASLWYMQQAQETTSIEEREVSAPPQHAADRLEPQAQEDVAPIAEDKETVSESVWRRPEKMAGSLLPEQPPAGARPVIPDAAIEKATLEDSMVPGELLRDAITPPSWDDAIRAAWARAQLAFHQRTGRRIALAVMASLALFLLLVVWAWPAPASHLTWYESLLVKLGVAEVPQRAPAPPTGNPNVRVWVDVHTALYYCPGSDLYGKTPGGQFEAQRDAQQDHFEPATGTLCE